MAQMSGVPLTDGQMSDNEKKQMLRARQRRNSFDYRQRQKQKKGRKEQLLRSIQMLVESLTEEIWEMAEKKEVMQTKIDIKCEKC
jgi:hypothetical protein